MKTSKSKALKNMKESSTKMSFSEAKNKTYGVHQLGLKDKPGHKSLDGKEIKY